MITLFQVDKSGSDIFEKDYSISLIKDKKEVYGINIPQAIKDKLVHLFNTGTLNITSTSPKKAKLRFKLRFHIAIIILLMRRAIKDEGYIDELNVELCNDLDGHFHEIRDMIYKNISKMIPSLNEEDIVQTKFPKTALVDVSARNLREKNTKEINKYHILKINFKEVLEIVKK